LHGVILLKPANNNTSDKKISFTYKEKQIGKTLYRVTSVYKGEVDLQKALEDLTVRKILKAYAND
jgi:hypothetical protein